MASTKSSQEPSCRVLQLRNFKSKLESSTQETPKLIQGNDTSSKLVNLRGTLSAFLSLSKYHIDEFIADFYCFRGEATSGKLVNM